MTQLGPVQTKIIVDGLSAQPGSAARKECERVLRAQGYERTPNLSDPVAKATLKIVDGLAPGAGADETAECERILRDYGYVKAGPANLALRRGAKPGPKPRAGRNPSRDIYQESIRATRLLLLLNSSYIEHDVIGLVIFILREFFTNRDRGVFFTSDDRTSISNCVPFFSNPIPLATSKTFQDVLDCLNSSGVSKLSVPQFESQLASLPILDKPKINDPVHNFANEEKLIECFKSAKIFHLSNLVKKYFGLRQSDRDEISLGQQFEQLRKLLGSATISRPKILKSAHGELMRITEHFEGAQFLTKNWVYSIAFVFGAMDAAIMSSDAPSVSAADYSDLVNAAVCRQFNKPIDDPVVSRWFER